MNCQRFPASLSLLARLSVICMLGLGACVSPSTGKVETCPTCDSTTERVAVADLSATKHVCPTCSSVQVFDDYGENPSQSVGEVHVCGQCDAIIEVCTLCDR